MILGTLAVVLAVIIIIAFVGIAVLAVTAAAAGVGSRTYARLVPWGGILMLIAWAAGTVLVIDGLVAAVLAFAGVTL